MSDSKELATQNAALPTTLDAREYGINLGEEDLPIPRVQLVQPTSAIDGAGKFFYSLTKELFTSIECVVFSNARGRVMFDPDMSKQATICGSNDRVIPSPRFETPMAKSCVDCNYHKRDYFEKIIVSGKEVKQMCQETQALRAMFVDNLMPFLFVARRTALYPINEFLAVMQFETIKHKKPLCCFPIRITSKLVTKPNQKFYVPVIDRLGMIDRDEFRKMMDKYKDYNPDKTFEAEETTTNNPITGDGEDVPF